LGERPVSYYRLLFIAVPFTHFPRCTRRPYANIIYICNDRGMALLTSTMVPKNNAPIRGVICLCHGFMDNASFLKRIHYQRFVKKGFAVVMIEYEGHGRSDGPNCLIPCWDTLLGDVHKYFIFITETKFPGKKKFLIGESMGGFFKSMLICTCSMRSADTMLHSRYIIQVGRSRTTSFPAIAPSLKASYSWRPCAKFPFLRQSG